MFVTFSRDLLTKLVLMSLRGYPGYAQVSYKVVGLDFQVRSLGKGRYEALSLWQTMEGIQSKSNWLVGAVWKMSSRSVALVPCYFGTCQLSI